MKRGVEPLKKAILIVSQIDMGCARTFAIFALSLAAWGQRLQGDVEFFGHRGLDEAKLRAAIDASRWSPGTVRSALATARVNTTDVAIICCDDQRRKVLFVGIPGASYRPFSYNPEPVGPQRLGREAQRLADAADRSIEQAVRRGGDAASEDDSTGYALIKDPAARKQQLLIRQYALAHESELRNVLAYSAHVRSRQVASEFLGYSGPPRPSRSPASSPLPATPTAPSATMPPGP